MTVVLVDRWKGVCEKLNARLVYSFVCDYNFIVGLSCVMNAD